MGGQACVFYGAAEFSRDVDFVLLAEPDNLKRLQSALDELEAEIIAIPPFDESFLNSGLAVHFRFVDCGSQIAKRGRSRIRSHLSKRGARAARPCIKERERPAHLFQIGKRVSSFKHSVSSEAPFLINSSDES